MRILTILTIGALCAPFSPAHADASRYDACIALAQTNPTGALALARGWRDNSGASAHCQAQALIALAREPEAEKALLRAADETQDAAARSDIFVQLGDLRMRRGDIEGARNAYDSGLSFNLSSAAAFVGRARTLAARQDWAGAFRDLTAALAFAPEDARALSLRAAARRRLDQPSAAAQDAAKAVQIAPDSALAHFELGAAFAALGDLTSAASEWRVASQLEPTGAAGDLARRNLARLENQDL